MLTLRPTKYVINMLFIGVFSDRPTVFFDSHLVSKPDSSSQLNILDPEEDAFTPQLDTEKLDKIVKIIRKEFKLTLFGIDIVVENGTQRHAIIDINVYPGNFSFSFNY